MAALQASAPRRRHDGGAYRRMHVNGGDVVSVVASNESGLRIRVAALEVGVVVSMGVLKAKASLFRRGGPQEAS